MPGSLAEAEAAADGDGVRSISYSSIGLEPGVDILLWRMGPSVDALEAAAARLLRSGLGRWLTVSTRSSGGSGHPSTSARPTEQEQSLFCWRTLALPVVYPFTKSTDWYLLVEGERARA